MERYSNREKERNISFFLLKKTLQVNPLVFWHVTNRFKYIIIIIIIIIIYRLEESNPRAARRMIIFFLLIFFRYFIYPR